MEPKTWLHVAKVVLKAADLVPDDSNTRKVNLLIVHGVRGLLGWIAAEVEQDTPRLEEFLVSCLGLTINFQDCAASKYPHPGRGTVCTVWSGRSLTHAMTSKHVATMGSFCDRASRANAVVYLPTRSSPEHLSVLTALKELGSVKVGGSKDQHFRAQPPLITLYCCHVVLRAAYEV